MAAARWRLAVRPHPDWGARAACPSAGGVPGGEGGTEPLAASHAPQVLIFPFLSEQGSHGERAKTADERVLAIPQTFERLFPEVSVTPVEPLEPGRELDFQGSGLKRFLRHAWPHLRAVNVLVTHRNFLANEVLRRAEGAGVLPAVRPGRIPNAAVIELRVQDPGGLEKTIFFVRHCTSHHNAALRGSGAMTTCADVGALRRLAASGVLGDPSALLYGSSVLPRAVLSALALQRPLAPSDLERVRQTFDAAAEPASREEISSYQASHACRDGEDGAFCSAKPSSFIVASNEI